MFERVWSYQLCFPRRETFDGYGDEEKRQCEGAKSLSGSCLQQARLERDGQDGVVRTPRQAGQTYNDPVVPGKYGKLVEACDQIPSGGDVASYEDTEGEDGERVHRIRLGL